MAKQNDCLQPDLSGYPELLKPKDVQVILRVSQYRAYRLFHSKGFPSVTLGISGLFIPKARLMVWLGYGTGPPDGFRREAGQEESSPAFVNFDKS